MIICPTTFVPIRFTTYKYSRITLCKFLLTYVHIKRIALIEYYIYKLYRVNPPFC